MFSDFDEFVKEGSGEKLISSFYDTFLDIEPFVKLCPVQRCSAKADDFNIYKLAKLIDDQFYVLTDSRRDQNDPLIRPVGSCHLDFRRRGAFFESNSQRSYFEGHERQDVVQHREKFV